MYIEYHNASSGLILPTQHFDIGPTLGQCWLEHRGNIVSQDRTNLKSANQPDVGAMLDTNLYPMLADTHPRLAQCCLT